MILDHASGNIIKNFKNIKRVQAKKKKKRLSNLFYEIFSTKTGYDGLDNRIELTKKKKDSLLVVLDYPDTPLHNNPAELALRMYVIKRKISFGTKSKDGTKSWETFLPLWTPVVNLVLISETTFTIKSPIKIQCHP